MEVTARGGELGGNRQAPVQGRGERAGASLTPFLIPAALARPLLRRYQRRRVCESRERPSQRKAEPQVGGSLRAGSGRWSGSSGHPPGSVTPLDVLSPGPRCLLSPGSRGRTWSPTPGRSFLSLTAEPPLESPWLQITRFYTRTQYLPRPPLSLLPSSLQLGFLMMVPSTGPSSAAALSPLSCKCPPLWPRKPGRTVPFGSRITWYNPWLLAPQLQLSHHLPHLEGQRHGGTSRPTFHQTLTEHLLCPGLGFKVKG